MSSEPPLEPLLFQRRAQPAVWGGRALAEQLGVASETDEPIGETWELSDLPGAETRVRGGAFDGCLLHELLAERADEILGESRAGRDGRFPLLVKFIEARQDLSVQVHPRDGDLGLTVPGKTEAWYFLPDCTPEARVIAGLKLGAAVEAFARDAASRAVLDHLRETRVHSGDCLLIQAGTPHSIRAGAVLLEVQQSSDVTLRMYDWDRVGLDGQPREIHVDQALQVIDFAASAPEVVRASFPPSDPPPLARIAPLASCEFFRLHEVRLTGAADHDPEGFARVLVVVDGSGTVSGPSGEAKLLRFGDTILLPARLGAAAFEPGPRGLHLIEAVAL